MATTMATQERWLQCQLDKGMFSDEIAVTYPPEGVAKRSVFVPKSEVHGEPGQRGFVRVRVLRKPGAMIAILPSSQSDIVAITEQDVSDAP